MNFDFRLSQLLSRVTCAKLREDVQKSENVPKRDENPNLVIPERIGKSTSNLPFLMNSNSTNSFNGEKSSVCNFFREKSEKKLIDVAYYSYRKRWKM